MKFTESRENLQHVVNKSKRVCEGMSLKIEVDKIKVMVIMKNQTANVEKKLT